MRLPPDSAHYSHRVRDGRYVARRLRREKRIQLAETIESATSAILDKGRAVEDAAGPVQEALADRDACDDELDGIAKNARLALASRSVDAIKKAPYTQIFHSGIEYYTSARIDDELARYGELKSRLIEYLPDNDDVRTAAVPSIENSLNLFSGCVKALTDARNAESIAKTALLAAEEDWERVMTKTYGLLVAEIGRNAAARFFPKRRKRSNEDDETPE